MASSVVVVASLVAMAACASDGRPGDAAGGPPGGGVLPEPTAEGIARFGYGAIPDPNTTYQPDVVFVGGGASAVREVSDDWLTYLVDRDAPGVGEVDVGEVMVLTATATGRVLALADEAGGRRVTLRPVELTDIVRDGRISVSEAVDPAGVTPVVVPAMPSRVDLDTGLAVPLPPDEPVADDEPPLLPPAGAVDSAASPGIQLVAALPARVGPPAPPAPPAAPPVESGPSVEVPLGGNWKGTMTGSSTGFTVGATHTSNQLKAGVTVGFVLAKPILSGNVDIAGGQVTSQSVDLSGLNAVEVSLIAGIGESTSGRASGSADAGKLKFEFPVKWDRPIPPSPATAGLPLNVSLSATMSVQIALVGNNSTLFASGRWRFAGPVGAADGLFSGPSVTVEKSILDSISGLTLGPSGVVSAAKFKVLVGVGVPTANAGPFAALTVATGVTNGSSLGAPLARCRGASLDIFVGGGVEMSVSEGVSDFLAKVLPGKPKIVAKAEFKENVFQRKQILPDVPLCRGAS